MEEMIQILMMVMMKIPLMTALKTVMRMREETESSEEDSESSFARFARSIIEGEIEESEDSSLLTLWDILWKKVIKSSMEKVEKTLLR